MRCHLYCASFFWAEANCSAIADADVICLLEWDFVASSSSHFCPSPSAFYCVIGIQGLWTHSFLELDFVTLSERVNYSCPCTGTFLFLCISLRKTSAVSSWRIGYNPLEPIRNLLAPCGFRSLTGACTVTTCLWKCSSVASMCSPTVCWPCTSSWHGQSQGLLLGPDLCLWGRGADWLLGMCLTMGQDRLWAQAKWQLGCAP